MFCGRGTHQYPPPDQTSSYWPLFSLSTRNKSLRRNDRSPYLPQSGRQLYLNLNFEPFQLHGLKIFLAEEGSAYRTSNMLQCGGANNHSAALLKEFFSHERRCHEQWRRPGPQQALHPNTTGILPCVTAHTDAASLRRGSPRNGSTSIAASPRAARSSAGSTPRARRPQRDDLTYGLVAPNPYSLPNSPSPLGSSGSRPGSSPRRSGSASRPMPYELPHHGIGQTPVPAPPDLAALDANGTGRVRPPSHGCLPPYGRKSRTAAFYDTIATGGIACLSPRANIPIPRGTPRGELHAW